MESNVQKMREALEFADKELRMATEDSRYGDDVVYLVGCMRSVASVCRSAISAPPRNCDIFTTGAKINEGIREWCRNHDCDKCPFLNDGCDSCYASWMLSTATEGGAE